MLVAPWVVVAEVVVIVGGGVEVEGVVARVVGGGASVGGVAVVVGVVLFVAGGHISTMQGAEHCWH